MKFLKLSLGVVAVLFVFGCSTESRQRDFTGMPPTEITVSVTCSGANSGFSGTIVSDGKEKPLSGDGSATFHASGHEIICSFKKTSRKGRISIAVAEGGKELGTSTTGPEFDGVRAEVVRTPAMQCDAFTTF